MNAIFWIIFRNVHFKGLTNRRTSFKYNNRHEDSENVFSKIMGAMLCINS